HVGLHHHGIGTGFERLEHWHGRAHAADARHIAGGADDAALAAADDERFVAQFGMIALLDRGIEGVAIEMRDAECVNLVMKDETRPAADGTAGGALCRLGEAVAAKSSACFPSAHGTSSLPCWLRDGQSQAAPRTPLASP